MTRPKVRCKMHLFSFLLVFGILILPLPCRCQQNDASTKELIASINRQSQLLSEAMEKDVSERKEAVILMSKQVSELAKSVDLRINSGDLANVGDAATKNIRDAVVKLSENWDLAINTADLKEMGIEVAQHLSEAIQNINARITVYAEVGDNVVSVALIISIAVAVSLSVIFIAIAFVCRNGTCCHCQNVNMNCFQRSHNEEKDVEMNSEDESTSEDDTEKDDLKTATETTGMLNNTRAFLNPPPPVTKSLVVQKPLISSAPVRHAEPPKDIQDRPTNITRISDLQAGKYYNLELVLRVSFKGILRSAREGRSAAFSFHALDDSDEIEVVCSGKEANHFHSRIELNGVYNVRNFTVQKRNMEYYNGLKNELQLVFSQNSEASKSEKNASQIPFWFLDIKELEDGSVKAGSNVDIVGKVEVDHGKIVSERDVTRNIVLVDLQSNGQVLVTLSGAHAEFEGDYVSKIIALRKCPVVKQDEKMVLNPKPLFTLVWVDPPDPPVSLHMPEEPPKTKGFLSFMNFKK